MALQAVGILKICTGFLIVMNAVAFLGHINVMVLAGVESGVVRIQISVLVGLPLKFSLIEMSIMRSYLLGSLHTEQKYMMVDLLTAERV